ncbi:MAG: DUF2254 family protein [Methanoregulaceae archaeon]
MGLSLDNSENNRLFNSILAFLVIIFLISLVSFSLSLLNFYDYGLEIDIGQWILFQTILFFLMVAFFHDSFYDEDFRTEYRVLSLMNQNTYLSVIYFSVFITSIIIFNFISPFINPNLNFPQTILQTQSIIIMIIISFTILAVQYVNEIFSSRFGEYFKISTEWKIFLGIFLITIIIALLMLISNQVNHLLYSIESILVIYSFLIIPIFIWNSITMMRAENIVEHLAKEKIPHAVGNPLYLALFVQLYFDLGRYSIERRDLRTNQYVKSHIHIVKKTIDELPIDDDNDTQNSKLKKEYKEIKNNFEILHRYFEEQSKNLYESPME